MKHIVLLLLISLTVANAQKQEKLTCEGINNYTREIDSNEDYKRLHSDGEIQNKRLILFNKHIGSFYSNVVYADSSIFMIENVHRYNKDNKEQIEKYYFKNNKIIKYIEEHFDKKKLAHKLIVFYNDTSVIRVDSEVHDGFEFNQEKQNTILTKSLREISQNLEITQEWDVIFNK